MIHDLIPLTVNGSMPSRIARMGYQMMLRATLARSQLVLVPSQATADGVISSAPRLRSRVSVVHHAIDVRFRPAGQTEIGELLSQYELDSGYVLAVAGDRPHKNLARLTAAWEALDPATRGETVLALAGFPLPRVDHPAIRVLGAVPDRDLPALYTGALSVVVPSLEEGFGLPVVEAMACGTAVVCSDRPALREVGGDGALFFDPTDRDAIGEALARILIDDDIRRDLGQGGPQRVTRFAADLIAGRLLDELRAVVLATNRRA